jgi:hypothetical protein
MKIKDLKKGDILLFSPEKRSFTSWAITFLSGADVSHAAMFYNKDDETIIEETPPRVAISPAGKRFAGRRIHVNRLKKIADLDEVISVSHKYLNGKECYDKTGLYLVGKMLIYKKFTPNTRMQKIVVKILKKITAYMVSYINEQKKLGKLPMVCSQFVAQCYEDAGSEYKLNITNGNNKPDSLLDNVMSSQTNSNKENSWSELLKSNKNRNVILSTDEELCEELKDAFKLQNPVKNTSMQISQELIDAVSDFGHVHNLLHVNNDVKSKNQTTPFGALKDMENMFVTPGNLLNNCSNLQYIGEIEE